jgi:hypothetical protein
VPSVCCCAQSIARQPEYYINKIVIGMMLLCSMSFFIFSLNVNEPDRQMGTISIFLAMIAYLFVTSSDLPKVPYKIQLLLLLILNIC